ncbi:bromodomain-containing protein 4-like, partial [Trichogramma pretiosum]|uniref:bromodomain-containing protein 4-like n=1 Tax=Trichogramma pretiosum TaxID=7493 RepID=UPI0006C9C97D
MASSPKMTPWLMAFFFLVTTVSSLNATDQEISESQRDQQVAILKQIRKVNDDGSYTYGYEAGDGSFKEQISIVQNQPRNNRNSTLKKPQAAYSSTTESATKLSVVQPIPRIRKPSTLPTTSVSGSTLSTTETPRPGFIRPKARHRLIINGQQRPVVLEEEQAEEVSEEVTKPSTSEKSTTVQRVVFTKRPVELNLPPITEEFEDKEEEPKITTGNALRRQLKEEASKTTPVVELDDDQSDVYGGSLSTSRPLFTTSSPPRSTTRLASLRKERLKPIFINQNNGPAKFEEQESKNVPQEDRNTAQQVLVRTTTRPPKDQASDSKEYARQSTEPLYVRQQPGAYLREGGVLVPGNQLEEDAAYQQIPLSRLLLRQEFGRQPLYPGVQEGNVQYLTDSPPVAHDHEEAVPRVPINPGYLGRHRAYPRQLLYGPEVDARRGYLRPVPQPLPPDERDYQNAPYPYRGPLALPPEPPNPIAPPLSRRDFQYLLRRLLISQYGLQALSYPREYLEDALYDQQQYYDPAYGAPRGGLPYPPEGPIGRPVPVVPPPPPYPEGPLRRPIPPPPPYSRALNPIYQREYEDYPDTRYAKRVYRQKFYAPDAMSDDGEDILPPQIREALLLRMLQLAISADRPVAMPNMMYVSTTAAPLRYRKGGPVRSVQIIGEDSNNNEEKETR